MDETCGVESQIGGQERSWVPGELFKTVHAEAMSALRLERLP